MLPLKSILKQLNSKVGLLVLICFLFLNLNSQIDSVSFYKKIKTVADKSKFATLIYDAVFVNPTPQEYPKEPSSKEEKMVNPYLKSENKIIRKIHIVVNDPFGYSINDTSYKKVNSIQKLGNVLHVASYKKVINNRLLFKENEQINALSLSESERLLRQTTFINDARIFVSDLPDTTSADVYVIVHDKWTVTVPFNITDLYINERFKNQSVLGTGHQFEQFVQFTRPNEMTYSGFYNASNIGQTYVSSRLYYETNKNGTGIGASVESPFYSPLAKWAGGINVLREWKYFNYQDTVANVNKRTDLYYSRYDVWLGKSIKINSKRKFFKQSANFIVGERFYIDYYDKRPSFQIDINKTNINSSTIIGNLGFAVQQYYKEKFVYRFGANEDVPHGLILQLLYGATENELGISKYYLGGEIARAKHYSIGYFSTSFSYGMFFGSKISNDITSRIKINYFSNLLRVGKWYVREFMYNNWVYGINKLPGNNLTLTSGDLYGFEGSGLSGNMKAVLNLETVAYAPYNLIGFRFAPTLLLGYGMLGNSVNNFAKSNLYQAYAVALMVRNENLLSSTFQISFGMYPLLPNGDTYGYKYGPVTSFTLRVNPFIVARPEFISY